MTKKQVSHYLIMLSAVSKKKELVVVLADDDLDDQALFRDAAKESGVDLKLNVVNNGEMLMDYLNRQSIIPDVIFLDLNMPCMNGYECLDKIRHNEKFHDIPVVIFSTSVNKPDLVSTYNKGANLYFPKPHSYELLVENLKKLLSMEKTEIMKRREFDNFLFG